MSPHPEAMKLFKSARSLNWTTIARSSFSRYATGEFEQGDSKVRFTCLNYSGVKSGRVAERSRVESSEERGGYCCIGKLGLGFMI